MSLKNNFRKLLTYKLGNKYNVKKNFYNIKKINELIFDVSSKYTAIFKEYLLFEDENDFLRRFYNKKELKKKLKGILYFYEKYSKIFPNYIIIEESKYLYKNIKKKQKMIDNLQEIKEADEKKAKNKKNFNKINDTVFTQGAINSICNQTDSFYKLNLKNIIELDNYENNNILDKTIKDFEKIIKNIEHYENKQKENINNNNSTKNNFIINQKNPNFFLNLLNLNSPRVTEGQKNNSLFSSSLYSPKNSIINSQKPSMFPTIANITLNNKSLKANKNNKFIIHSKIKSVNVINENVDLRKKILKLENNNSNVHIYNKPFIKPIPLFENKNSKKLKNFSMSRQRENKLINKFKKNNKANILTERGRFKSISEMNSTLNINFINNNNNNNNNKIINKNNNLFIQEILTERNNKEINKLSKKLKYKIKFNKKIPLLHFKNN